MTKRKNVTLPPPYEQMYQELSDSGEFKRAFGSFSAFVQEMLERYHEDPERIRAEYHKKKAEKHRRLMEEFEDKSSTSLEEKEQERELKELEFFTNLEDSLKNRKNSSLKKWEKNRHEVYRKFEDAWVQKYSKKFGKIDLSEFRQKAMNHIDDELQEEIQEVIQVEARK